MPEEIMLRIEGHTFPPLPFEGREHVWLAIQEGQERVMGIPAYVESVVFEIKLRVGTRKNGEPNFLGPYAHGTPQDRFVYLCWYEKLDDGTENQFRRIKLKLGHLTWAHLNAAPNGTLTVRVTLTDGKGQPICASLKPPYVEWKI